MSSPDPAPGLRCPHPASERDAILGDVERFLHAMVGDLDPSLDEDAGRGRPRILPALAL